MGRRHAAPEPADDQLALTHLAELAYEDQILPASAFPPSSQLLSPEPTADFVKNIKRRGIINPVHAYRQPDGTLYVMAGKRRVKAARKINPEYPIPTRLYANVAAWDALTIETADNASRRPNDLSDLAVLMRLHTEGKSLAYSMLPKATIRKRMKIIGLEGPILQAVIDGRVSMGTAEALARLTAAERQPFVEQLSQGKKITARQVAQTQWAKTTRAVQAEQPALPADDLADDAGNLFLVLNSDLGLSPQLRRPIAGYDAALRVRGKNGRVFKLVEM